MINDFKKEKYKILVVDDDLSTQSNLRAILKSDFNVITASTGYEALEIVKTHQIDILLLDIGLPDSNGLELLKDFKDTYKDIEVIMITALKEIGTAVRAMQKGAYDYITKDFDIDDLKARIWKAIAFLKRNKKLIYLEDKVEKPIDSKVIIGKNPAMQFIWQLIQKVSKVPTTVLLLGESGTGKELIAKLIWQESDLVNAPFVPVNLASIPGDLVESNLFGHEKGAFTGAVSQSLGKFELANNGFLFLDEIGDFRLDLQAKLLRAIQEGEIERVGGNKRIKVDTRLIVATNKNLLEMVKKGEFREDLYYRINVVPINIPPFRERIEDMPTLINHFIDKYRRKFNQEYPTCISDKALEILSRYNWPGNIRELENFIERFIAILDKDEIGVEDLPVEIYTRKIAENTDTPYDEAVKKFEIGLIIQALKKASYNKTKAAKMLGLSLSTFKYKFANCKIQEILSYENH